MAKTRVSKKVVTAVTVDAFQEALGEFATADAREKTLTAKMDEQITRIREKYADELSQCAERKEAAREIAQVYCQEQKEELFTKKRSIETAHGVVGFRLGTPKLKTLKGFTWPSVTNMLKEFLPDYVRTVDEPAKDKLLADRDSELVAPLLQKVGVMVDQDESFFIELKKEEAALA